MLITACANKSIYSVGIERVGGERLAGVVSQNTGKKAQSFINHFHNLILKCEYADAYQLLSKNLRKQLSYAQFTKEFSYLDTNYGQESSFTVLLLPIAMTFTGSDAALYRNGFSYYDVVILNYVSQRNIDIIYSFGITKQGLSIKICSIGFHDQKGWAKEYNGTIYRKN